MDPFEAWVQTAPSASVQRYKDELLKLGANFDSFKREASEVVDDLVSGGIPRMAARDVYGAVAEVIAKRSVPLAVFWDVENLPVPSVCTGRHVASRLKSVLVEYGDLVEFRGYASIGLNNIPEEKRSDLQLSGCHLVDCPHNGRKEVADKMIIVDAMDFVIDRPDGAVLCFITGDTDYAYLLAKLQKRKNCRTIVISRGTADSMLHVSCDVKLQWETDVLQLDRVPDTRKTVASGSLGAPPGFSAPSVRLLGEAKPNVGLAPTSYASVAIRAPDVTTVSASSDSSPRISFPSRIVASSQSLSVEVAKDLIQQAMSRAPDGARFERGCLKSYVGNFLRISYPTHFPDREVVKEFFAFAVGRGLVVETGEREYKMLSLPGSGVSTGVCSAPSMTESLVSPLPIERMPARALEVVSSLPFIIFIPWALCPSTKDLPKGTFVQSYEYMAILMYKSKLSALSAVDECPPLRRGTLVDWKKVAAGKVAVPMASPKLVSLPHPADAAISAEESAHCSTCDSRQLKSDMYKSEAGVVCESCFVFSDEEAIKAQQKVIELLEVLADNDDICVGESMLRKLLHLKHPDECASKKQAALWITSAVNVGLATILKKEKNKVVCLTRNYREVALPFPPDDMETSAEERYVCDLLWESPGAWLSRASVGKSLGSKFERMSRPYMRSKVFMNAAKSKKFFLAKSEYGHAVALTEQDAYDALRYLLPPSLVAATSPESISSDVDVSVDEKSTASSEDD